MSPPSTPIGGKFWGGGEISSVAKSRVLNLNALAYAERAMST